MMISPAELGLLAGHRFEHDRNCGLPTATSPGGECDCGADRAAEALDLLLERLAGDPVSDASSEEICLSFPEPRVTHFGHGHVVSTQRATPIFIEGDGPDESEIALQRLHDLAEQRVRDLQRAGGERTAPITAAHLGGVIVGIRRSMAAIGMTEVRSDTGIHALAAAAPSGPD